MKITTIGLNLAKRVFQENVRFKAGASAPCPPQPEQQRGQSHGGTDQNRPKARE